jgi:hypothetical protein
MSMSTYDIPLVLGSVRGWRGWIFNLLSGRLNPISQSGPYDPFQKIYVADCFRYFNEVGLRHDAPALWCKCGLYALYNATKISQIHEHVGFVSVILGSVKMSGRIIFGETGVMRGEKMELEALLLPRESYLSTDNVKRTISAMYRVPVFSYTEIDDFYLKYPCEPPDLSRSVEELQRAKSLELRKETSFLPGMRSGVVNTETWYSTTTNINSFKSVPIPKWITTYL